MHYSPRVGLVIPCFNEGERLDIAAFRSFLLATSSVHLVFVDDGSADETLSKLGAVCEGIRDRATILSYRPNKGKAEAVRFGINHALNQLKTEIVGFWDADLATPLEELPHFLAVLDRRPEIAMVFGARVKLLGRNVERLPHRHYLGRVFATVVSSLLEIPIYDTQCGAKLFRSGPQLRQAFEAPFLSTWVFDVEIIARFLGMYDGDCRHVSEIIYEYPLATWVDVAGSKVRAKHFVKACLDILQIAKQLPRFGGRTRALPEWASTQTSRS
jgi:dolichyl-phosphate beta-glucosyltransferase